MGQPTAGLLLSTVSGWRAFSQEGAGCQHFSSCPQLSVPEAKFQVSVVLRWLLPSPHYWNAESATENAEACLITLHGFMRWWFHVRRDKLRTPRALLPLHLALRNQHQNVKENCATGPTPRAPAQVLCLGENWGIKQIA